MTKRMFVTLLCASAATLLWGWRAWPQTTGKPLPPLVIESMSGRDLYDFYCASCHGRQGHGDGPTAPALKTLPPDLTTLARRGGGAFPAGRVLALVTHGEPLPTPAHGSKEMPVWGPVFLALDPSDTRTKVRISNIVDYVAALQAKP
jgi:mono/diheme cytochrome c family protein